MSQEALMPRAWAEIDLGAVSRNLAILRRSAGHAVKVMLVVKADAYGHGAVAVARHVLARGEAQALGVGDSEEALELREAGIDAPILILGAVVDGEMEAVVRNDVSICVHSQHRIRSLAREARHQGRKSRVHLMVDTGMGRLGPFPEKALELAAAVHGSDWLELEGIATHLSSATQADDPFTREQLERFRGFRRALERSGIVVPVVHAANSGAVLYHECSEFNLVRVGAAAYGIFPGRGGAADELEPALSLLSQVIYLKDVPAGTPISYDRLHVTPRKTRIATLPIGYNDGLRHGLSDRWEVLVRGRRAPVVGAVSMDYCMVDVGAVPGVRTGDRVIVLGREGEDSITVPQMAKALGTVPHEVTCGLGKRIRRIYRPERNQSLTDAVGLEAEVGSQERVSHPR